MAGADGGLSGMRPGAVWADFSTTDYHNTLRLAELCEQQGAHALECPVTNLHQLGVEVCNCAFFVGGQREHIEKVQAELEVMGQKAFPCGSIGQAQTVKLVTNLTFYAGVALGTEALLAAQKAGIPPLVAWRYLQAGSAVSPALRHFLPNVLDGSLDGSCSLEVVHKDMNLTKELDREFRDKGSPHAAWRVMPGTNALFNAAAERYPVEGNHLLVSKHLAEINGTSLEVPGFTSPSHHGADKDYRIPAFHRDAVGRVQPFVPARVTDEGPDGFQPSPEQEALLQDLEEWLTFSNYACYLDAEALGLGFGLTPEYIHHLVTWSVGCSWVADHLPSYTAPDMSALLSKVDRLSEGLELPVTRSLVQAVRERHAGRAAEGDAWARPVANLQTLTAPEPMRIRTLSARRLEAGDARELARLRASLEEHGIFWLDVPDADVGFSALRASPSFFHLPGPVKSRFSAEEHSVYPKTCRGFTRVGGETLNPEEGPDCKETFDMGIVDQPLPGDPRALPFNGPTLLPRTDAADFVAAAEDAQRVVMQRWLPTLVRSIDMAFEPAPGKELGPCLAEPTLIQRFLFYPRGSKAFAGRHTDNGVFTVLFAEDPLPEARGPAQGFWQAVAPGPRPLPLVFAGDVLQHWSDGRVLSLPHRVRHTFGSRDRKSLAFFIYPNVSHTVQPVGGGEALRVADHMLKNFAAIWEEGTGAGQAQKL
uniref:Fe2OG dioxygenase domain-containing protein n=1 Tax=Pyrodinium bahamense TaxID=73915 RepID=A0A7S0A6K9_9DINO